MKKLMPKNKKKVLRAKNSQQSAFSYAVLAFSRLSFLTHLPQRVLVYLLIFTLSLSVRLLFIDFAPVAVTHDEVFYANQAQALAQSGTAQDGVWRPSDLVSAHPLFAEWPAVVMQPGFWFFSNSPLLASRFMSALVGALIPLVLAELTFALFQKKEVATATVVLSSVNPWLFQVSRHSFDIIFTVFFYLLSMLILIKLRQFWKLLAIPPLLLGFLQYQGGKVMLIPLILLTLLYLVFESIRKRGVLKVNGLISITFVLFVSIVTTVSFGYFLSSQPAATRVSNISILDISQIEQHVKNQRQMMVTVELLPTLLFNKATVSTSTVINQVGKSIDFTQLFIAGERLRNPTTVLHHGLFYGLDLVLIFVGMAVCLLDKKWRSTGLFLLSIIFVGMLPQLLNNQDVWIFLRLGLSFAVLPIFAAVGLHYIWNRFEGQLFRRGAVVSMYALSVGYFAIQYAFVTPVTATGDKYFAERVLASYIDRLGARTPVVVLADESRFVFEEIVFYNGLIKRQQAEVYNAFKSSQYQIPGLRVATDCLDGSILEETVVITDQSVVPCGDAGQLEEDSAVQADTIEVLPPSVFITAPYSGEERFTIVNDMLCEGDVAPAHPSFTFRNLQVEKLSTQDFCRTFIIQQK